MRHTGDDAPVRRFGLALTPDVTLNVENDQRLATRIATAWSVPMVAADPEPLCVLSVGDEHRPPTPSAQLFRSSRLDGVWIDMGNFGPGCVLVCLPDVSHTTMLPWINALLLTVGVLPLHASAFTSRLGGIAVTGLAHSGKTGALLGAVEGGQRAIGDECVWWTQDRVLHPITLPVEVRLDYVREMPRLRRRVPPRGLLGAAAFGLASGITERPWPRLSRRLGRRARTVADPSRLFGRYETSHQLDHLFVSVRHDSCDVITRSLTTDDALDLIREIQLAEFRSVLAVRGSAAPFPGGHEELPLNRLEQSLTTLTRRLVAATDVHLLSHPYPVAGHRLMTAIESTR